MEPFAPPLEVDDRANELYWGSDRSVNQIAEDLDLSKGALYGMIRPLPAAMGCPLCATEVVHPNRTAMERGLVDCPSCGWQGTEEDTASYAPSGPGVDARPSGRARTLAAEEDSGQGTLLGGALLATALGLALLLWARRH